MGELYPIKSEGKFTLSAFVAPIENQIFAEMRATVLDNLPIGFDWTNLEYIRSFSKPILVFTCIYYGVFNVLVGPITEELFFRGYLTSHYKKQNSFTPILIAVLFSLYHFGYPSIMYFVYWHSHQ